MDWQQRLENFITKAESHHQGGWAKDPKEFAALKNHYLGRGGCMCQSSYNRLVNTLRNLKAGNVVQQQRRNRRQRVSRHPQQTQRVTQMRGNVPLAGGLSINGRKIKSVKKQGSQVVIHLHNESNTLSFAYAALSDAFKQAYL